MNSNLTPRTLGLSADAALMPLEQLYALWDNFADTPLADGSDDAEPDSIAQPFHVFGAGTGREEIWAWFESKNPDFVIGEVQQGIRRATPKAA